MPTVLQYVVQVGRDARVTPGAMSGSREFYLDAWVTGLLTGGFEVASVIREGNPFLNRDDEIGFVATAAFSGSVPTPSQLPDGILGSLAPYRSSTVSMAETPAGFVVVQTGETRVFGIVPGIGVPGWYVTSDGQDLWGSVVEPQGRSRPLSVAPTGSGDQAHGAVAAAWLGNPGFAVAWQDNAAAFLPPGGVGRSVAVARLFDADGAPITDAFAVAGAVSADTVETAPSVASTGASGYVVAWTDGTGRDGDGDSVRARLVALDGGMPALDFQLNQAGVGNQRDVSVLGLPGGFVAAWASATPQGAWQTVVRLFDATGTPLTDEITLAMPASSVLVAPELTTLDGGGFAVAFAAADGAAQRVYLQGFGPDGTPGFAPLPIGDQARVVDAATLVDGRVVVIGSELLQPGLYAHVVDARTAGVRLTGTSGDDGYVGTPFADQIATGDGNDAVYGLAGDDELFGGAGQDILVGGEGADALSGGRGGGFSLRGSAWLEARMGAEWRAVATADVAAGSFTVAWICDDGSIALWVRSGEADAALSPTVGRLGPEWRFAGLLDVDGMGTEALAFVDTLGRTALWRPFVPAPALDILTGRMGSQWTLAGFGDVDGTGGEEAIWIGADNAVAIWTIDARSGAVALAVTDVSLGPEWSFVAAGDLQADGTDDLVWRSDAGAVAAVSLSGARADGVRVLDADLGGGAVAEVRDLDRDGRDDLVVTTPDGDAALWLMRPSGVEATQLGGHMGPGWALIGATDGSGGLRPDLLWENAGEVYVWRLARDGDALSGGPGPDLFGFGSLDDAGAFITDFTPGQDRIALQPLALPEPGETDPMTASRLSVEATGSGALLRIDADPDPHVADWVVLATLLGVDPAALTSADLLL